MQCPHCHQDVESAEGQEFSLAECEACGQNYVEGANYCHNCGQSFHPEETEPEEMTESEEMQECSKCGRMAPEDDKFCAACGQSLDPKPTAKARAKASKKRVACSDGMCIGIIGPDGKCTECGKPYQG